MDQNGNLGTSNDDCKTGTEFRHLCKPEKTILECLPLLQRDQEEPQVHVKNLVVLTEHDQSMCKNHLTKMQRVMQEMKQTPSEPASSPV